MSDYETARLNMVESQVRPNGVTDQRILRAMLELPREQFVPGSMRALAYMDMDLPVKHASRESPARHLLAPMTLARLVDLAAVESGDLVLDIGCATGYSTAVLARLAEAVVGLESDAALSEAAARTLNTLGVDNAAVVTGPLRDGYREEGPYDVILVGGSVPDIAADLTAQLKDGGRLVAVLADAGVSRATVFERAGGHVSRRSMFDAAAPRLPGFEKPPAFVF